jgi:hypothetical protein
MAVRGIREWRRGLTVILATIRVRGKGFRRKCRCGGGRNPAAAKTILGIEQDNALRRDHPRTSSTSQNAGDSNAPASRLFVYPKELIRVMMRWATSRKSVTKQYLQRLNLSAGPSLDPASPSPLAASSRCGVRGYRLDRSQRFGILFGNSLQEAQNFESMSPPSEFGHSLGILSSTCDEKKQFPLPSNFRRGAMSQ